MGFDLGDTNTFECARLAWQQQSSHMMVGNQAHCVVCLPQAVVPSVLVDRTGCNADKGPTIKQDTACHAQIGTPHKVPCGFRVLPGVHDVRVFRVPEQQQVLPECQQALADGCRLLHQPVG